MQMAEIEDSGREKERKNGNEERERPKIKFFHLVSRSVCAIITFI